MQGAVTENGASRRIESTDGSLWLLAEFRVLYGLDEGIFFFCFRPLTQWETCIFLCQRMEAVVKGKRQKWYNENSRVIVTVDDADVIWVNQDQGQGWGGVKNRKREEKLKEDEACMPSAADH